MMKSIRHKIFIELAKISEGTVDELLMQCDPITRRQLQDNLNAACTEGLVSRRRDDATGLPAYRLTKAGNERLAGLNAGESFKGKRPVKVKPEAEKRKAEPVDAIDTSEKPVDNSAKNEQVSDFTLFGVIADIRNAIGDNTGKVMLGELAETIREIAGRAAQYDELVLTSNRNAAEVIKAGDMYSAEVVRVNRLCKAIERMAEAAGIDTPESADNEHIIGEIEHMRAEIGVAEAKYDGLNEKHAVLLSDFARVAVENTALKQLNKDMPSFGAVHEALKASQYLILSPKRKPQRVKSQNKAQDIALKAASVRGMAEVYALVPVGKAVRGAVWKDFK